MQAGFLRSKFLRGRELTSSELRSTLVCEEKFMDPERSVWIQGWLLIVPGISFEAGTDNGDGVTLSNYLSSLENSTQRKVRADSNPCSWKYRPVCGKGT